MWITSWHKWFLNGMLIAYLRLVLVTVWNTLSRLLEVWLRTMSWSETSLLILLLLLIWCLSISVLCIEILLGVLSWWLPLIIVVQHWLRLELLLIPIMSQNISAISATSHLSSCCYLTHSILLAIVVSLSVEWVIILVCRCIMGISQLILILSVSHLIISNWICIVWIVSEHFWLLWN